MSTWETRELPLLRAIAAQLSGEQPGGRGKGTRRRATNGVTVTQLTKATGFSKDEVLASLRVLAESHGPYITGRLLVHSERDTAVTGLTERARIELDKIDRDVHPAGPGAAVTGGE